MREFKFKLKYQFSCYCGSASPLFPNIRGSSAILRLAKHEKYSMHSLLATPNMPQRSRSLEERAGRGSSIGLLGSGLGQILGPLPLDPGFPVIRGRYVSKRHRYGRWGRLNSGGNW